MPKIPRVFHRVFGSAAGPTDTGQFGSFTAGAPAYTQNIDTIMGLGQWTQGWLAAVVGGTNDPFLEDENAVDLVHSQQIGYLLQAGIAEWDNRTTYYTGSFCTRNGLPYTSIQDANTGNDPLTTPLWWVPYDSTRTGVLLPFAGIVSPFGYGLCDAGLDSRTAQAPLFNYLTVQTTGTTGNGSAIVSGMATTANIQVGWPVSGPGIPAGAKVLTVDSGSQIHLTMNATATGVGVALVFAPWGVGDGTTSFNRPDYRGRSFIGAGAGPGLTARILGQATGEENHQLTVAEMPSHDHGVNDPTHVHPTHMGGWALNPGANELAMDPGQPNLGVVTSIVHAAATGITIQSRGGGGAHNVVHPSAACNVIIKY